MNLAQFIRENREPILREWEAFAKTCTPASVTMDIAALRDHADGMLTAFAKDLAKPQDATTQEQKSKGRARDGAHSAAEDHGAGRADSGFTVEQMVAEYRALRASVIRLWTKSQGSLVTEDIEDLTRFNEAIDQALAESVAFYNDNVEQSKEMFLGILGHDLRTPLGAMHTSARFMLETQELEEPHRTLTERIAASSLRTLKMVGDLLDFTRSRLGTGIPIILAEAHLGRIVRDVIDEVSAAHPGCEIRVDSRGEQRGAWDKARLAQALANLVSNAIEHGSTGGPVTVSIVGDGDRVSIHVHNRGVTIPPSQLIGIFNPMKVASSPKQPVRPTSSLGLGLYIAERIITAHGGRISVESTDEAGTTFVVDLPRNAPFKD